MQRVIYTKKSSSFWGYISAPPSKSHSHRLLFLALISKIPIRIQNILCANDINYSKQACKQLGMEIDPIFSQYSDQIKSLKCIPPKELKSEGYMFNCGNSGTTVRFLMGLSIAILGEIHLTGEFFIRNRPFKPLLDAMKNIGTEFSEGINGVTMETSKILKPILKIPGHFSSQFVSGLILGIIGLCLRPEVALQKNFHFETFIIETTSPQVSYPYIELTSQIFDHFGIEIEIKKLSDGCVKIIIPIEKITHLKKDEFEIPGDYSAIAPLLCGLTLFEETKPLSVNYLSDSGFQLNFELLEILGKLGLDAHRQPSGLKFYPPKHLYAKVRELTINCMGIPDLFPSLCVLGSYLPGTTTLTNIEHIRYKESNRVEVMVNHLREFGVNIEESDTLITIHGNPKIVLQRSHSITDIKDHRILMAFMIFAIGLEYNDYRFIIDNVEYIDDSYPRFLRDLQVKIGVKFDIEEEFE